MQTDRRTFLAALAAAAAALAARPLLAADKDKDEKKEGEWEKIGSKQAGRKEERDVIEVTSPNRYTAISFRVEKGDLEIEDVKITFADDEKKPYSPQTKLVFREGERSGKIDLPGRSRQISRIRFLYRTLGREVATVQVYGKIGKPADEKR